MKRHLSVLVLLLASLIHGALHAQTKRIAVAYSAISATQSGFYLAKDAKIFDKHGLSVDPVYVAGGSRVAQAIIAGEFAVALAGGNIVFANLAGGDIVTYGGVVNVPSFYLYVQPAIKTQEELRGKTLGITRYGASTDFTLRFLLKKWGLEPDRDVKVIQMGGQPEILAGMQAGVIHGGVLSSPGDFKAKRTGFSHARELRQGGARLPDYESRFYPLHDQKRPRNRKTILDGVQRGRGSLIS